MEEWYGHRRKTIGVDDGKEDKICYREDALPVAILEHVDLVFRYQWERLVWGSGRNIRKKQDNWQLDLYTSDMSID
jgi:hypothetical protein